MLLGVLFYTALALDSVSLEVTGKLSHGILQLGSKILISPSYRAFDCCFCHWLARLGDLIPNQASRTLFLKSSPDPLIGYGCFPLVAITDGRKGASICHCLSRVKTQR